MSLSIQAEVILIIEEPVAIARSRHHHTPHRYECTCQLIPEANHKRATLKVVDVVNLITGTTADRDELPPIATILKAANLYNWAVTHDRVFDGIVHG